MLRILFFVGLGLAAGGGLAAFVGPVDAGSTAITIGFLIAMFSGAAITVGKATKSFSSTASAKDIAAARSAGRLAVARVDALNLTGQYLNEQPLCEIELTVQPRYGRAFRAVARRIVLLTAIPQFQPGSRHMVVVLVEGQKSVAIIDDDANTAYWGEMPIPEASQAGELPVAGSADHPKKDPYSGSLLGGGNRLRPLRFVLYLLAFAVAVGAIIYPYRDAVEQTAKAIIQGNYSGDLKEPELLGTAIETLIQEIGHDQVNDVQIHSDFVRVNAPIVAGQTKTDKWKYHKGRAVNEGAASIQSRTELEQFSLKEVAWETISAAVQEAAAESGLDAKGAYISVQRAIDNDVHSDTFADDTGPIEVRIQMSDDYHSVSYRVNPDGTGLELIG